MPPRRSASFEKGSEWSESAINYVQLCSSDICEAHHLNEKSRQNSERMLMEEQDHWTVPLAPLDTMMSLVMAGECGLLQCFAHQECLRMEVSASSKPEEYRVCNP